MTHDHSDSCNHDHSHDREHAEGHAITGRKMALAVILTLTFVAGETIAGYVAHSLALLSDAGHNFADAAALCLSWYALSIAKKPSNKRMTFGYHRVGILAALVNAVSLVVIAVFILIEAVGRLRHPESVNSWVMIGVAAVAVVLNLVIGLWLHAGAKHDINIRGAYVHMVGDAISSFGVIIAGILVALTKASAADPIVSFVIAALILKSSWGILTESVKVLLEGTPEGIDMAAVIAAIRNVRGVQNVHDLHVWTVGPGVIACCCHVLIGEQTVREGQQVLRTVCGELDRKFKINHTTVQIEVEGHECGEMYCSIQPTESAHAGHHH